MRHIYFLILVGVVGLGVSAFQEKPKVDLKASMAKGQETYMTYCMSCHMDNGQGLEDVYPPLAKSDYMMADKKRVIQQILYGASGAMKVNGKTYNADMTGFDLSDDEVSHLVNFIQNSWGNKAAAVSAADVKASRK